MTIRHMRVLRAVCENDCSITKAAQALHLTQPAVSRAVRELERYYGVVLFDRLGRRMRLTDAGQRFLQYSRQITGLFDTMEQELRNGDAIGRLRVGASITIGSQFLPGYVSAFQAENPGVEIQVEVGDTGMLEKHLLAGSLDLALVEGRPLHEELRTESYMQDRLVVIAPNNGTFHSGQTLTAKQFRNQRFLLRERGSGTREEFERITEAAGFCASPVWTSTSTTALVNAVACGLGISVLPYRMVESAVQCGRILCLQVEGLSFDRCFWITWHRDKYLTPLCRRFVELCRSAGRQPGTNPQETVR